MGIKKRKTIVKSINSIILMLFVASLFFITFDVAHAGSPRLQGILDDVNSNCKNMNRGSGTWDQCEDSQEKLKAYGGDDCDRLFGEGSNKKWSITSGKNRSCQRAINNERAVSGTAQGMLNSIKNTCNGVGGVTWNLCESLQNKLKIIGCSGTMFENTSSGWNWKNREVNECQKVIDKIKNSPDTRPGEGTSQNGSGAGPGAGDDENDPDCSANFSNPLAWAMCPVIEGISDVTDWMFDDLIEPMLDDVPITTRPSDPGYKAWQSFRFLANIILIGAMLVLVYATARGGGGR